MDGVRCWRFSKASPGTKMTAREPHGRALRVGDRYELAEPFEIVRWMQAIAMYLRDAERVLLRLVGSGSDMTAPRGAEEELRVSEERFALAVLGAKDGIWDRDMTTDM